ncbi:hypothetical protein E2562_015401 [Oryza meyeriana var. granulata]|uniref:Uncharacterized protein n=1 Tax=Oryza meyeriana var. granulata TaxID=110450 RepID=A0A6G1EJY5_9ORYZ|nr:hypothetical protein E2562_015401 [Oryza meyeriana var. granulata]
MMMQSTAALGGAAGAHDAVEYGSLPRHELLPSLPQVRPRGAMEFVLLGGNHNMMVAADETGRAVLCDPGEHAVRTLPALPCLKDYSDSLNSATVRDDLYILDTAVASAGSSTTTTTTGAAMLSRRLPSKSTPTRWSATQTSGYPTWAAAPTASTRFLETDEDHRDGPELFVVFTAVEVQPCSAATTTPVGSACSTVATYWTLPFVGLVEYVQEPGLWFGLSPARDSSRSLVLSASDFDSSKPPVLRSLLPLEFTPPDALKPVSTYLVNLGSAKFCIARFFETDEDHRDGKQLFAVFTAVEVERCDDDDAGADGGGLRMLKHRSEMCKLTSGMMYWVL